MNNTEVTRQRKINIYNIINEERYRTLNIYIYKYMYYFDYKINFNQFNNQINK